ncbi:signal recognition particle-docking protein FtsY [Photobacterium sp. OFAV2-7]|uniref:signal recognition particle-docking protein FtsY n=1 Tax=Photobacterium sp. OFAV2-7 TaxID=2917748 RepID=UPI001EF47CE9|nr:signal recognition particle-docking protein FtsY [Photobacterium sp. OFAV2-7]MCG7584162.1 signal recognition particle-docking protein FtsY [Photobacterium sp. OFAV2-7]
MAEKKKRGLFSWLGFGSEEQTEQVEQNKDHQEVETQAEPTQDDVAAAKAAEEAEAQAAAKAVEEAEAQAAAKAAEEAQAQAAAKAAEEAEAQAAAKAAEEAEAQAAAKAAEEAEAQAAAKVAEAEEAEEAEAEAVEQTAQEPVVDETIVHEQEKPKSEGFFARLMRGLKKTKTNFGTGFISLFRGKKIDDDLFEELEEQLLVADVGMDTTLKIIENLTEKADRKDLKDGEALYGLLKDELGEMLEKVEQPLVVDTSKKPYVILMVGVNGVGKTTTIGKLAKQFQAEGKSVMLAAGDTFRAAAVEQLQVWGERNNVPVVAQHTGADSASVIFDAIESARARNVDVVIADTAGRLQNKGNLMEELRKIVRVMKKVDPQAPHEIMLTVDAGTGQNAISQAKLFSEVAPVSGITITKLDGTAKGGVIFAVADQFNIPIRYIGIGEGIDDLRPFAANEFIEALFSDEE